MKTTTQSTAWNSASGTLMAIANAGALITAIILTVSFLVATPVFAQDMDETTNIKVELREVERELGQAALEIQQALDEAGIDTGFKINIEHDDDDARPKLGVYLSDMDFEDAYKMRYPYAHGVLVDGTVRGGNADMAGIIDEDIIMYFGGTKVLYEDHLVRLIKSKHFGDQVTVIFWRDVAQDSVLVTFSAPTKKEQDKALAVVKEKAEKKKRKNSRGFGGGGFTPMLIEDNFADIGGTETTDGLMQELGLTKTPFREEGIVLWGGSGQGYVGNGWFLGGFGNGGGLSRTITANHSDGVTSVERKIDFAMGFGGLTVEKRFAPFSFATIGGGVGLGGGGMTISVTQDEGNFDWDQLNDQLIDTKSTSVSFSKAYFIAHPRANVMIKLTPWMRLKAEYGYMYGYSLTDGWNTTLNGGSIDKQSETYELVNSPNTPLEASTLSLGLWFGF